MRLAEQHNVKFTMGELLDIERKYNINPLDFPARKGIEDAEFELMDFVAKEVTPFVMAMEKKDNLNKKEQVKKNELLKKQGIIETKIEFMKIDYTYELLEYFTGKDFKNDEELDYNKLIEFKEDYEKATQMRFKVKSKGDTGK